MKRFTKDIHNTTDYYLIRCLQINRDEESLHELNRRYEKFCFKQMHKYKNYLEDEDDMDIYSPSSQNSEGKVKPSEKMGYISSVEDARKKLEDIYKLEVEDSKES